MKRIIHSKLIVSERIITRFSAVAVKADCVTIVDLHSVYDESASLSVPLLYHSMGQIIRSLV